MSVGSFGCWAQKAGDFHAREFDGTPGGLASAIAYAGTNGTVQVYPGNTGITVPAIPAGVRVVLDDLGRQRVFTAGGEVVAQSVNAREFSSIQAAIDSLSGAPGTVFVPSGTYTPSTTPSFSGITIPNNVCVRGAGPSTALSMAGTPNADAVKITGSYGAVTDLSIVGANSTGTGYGVNIYPTGVMAGARVERVIISNTPSWGIYVGRDDAINLAILTRIVDVNISGNVSTAVGSMHIGNGCTTLNAYDCFFGGNNTTGIYSHLGGTNMSMGQVHIRGTAAIRLFGCAFEPSGASACFSMNHSNFGVSLFGCYFEPETAGSRPHLITSAGVTRGFVLDEPFINSASTAVGLRLLKTSLQGGLREARIRGGHFQTAKTGSGTDDIELNDVTDDLNLQGCRWTDPVGDGELRVSLPLGGSFGVNQTRFTRSGHGSRLRLPMLTTTQRDALVDPMKGDVIFNTTTNVLNFHNGTSWGAV